MEILLKAYHFHCDSPSGSPMEIRERDSKRAAEGPEALTATRPERRKASLSVRDSSDQTGGNSGNISYSWRRVGAGTWNTEI